MPTPRDDDFEFDPRTLRYKPKQDLREPSLSVREVRGTLPTEHAAARELQGQLLHADDQGLQWGSMKLPSWPLRATCVFGRPGSGKTVLVRLMLQDLLPSVGSRTSPRPARALIYDPKRDLLPHIFAVHSDPSLVTITNPLDARSKRWNLALDFDTPAYARELAQLLVPLKDQDDKDSFYPRTVRIILTAVFESFIRTCSGQWTLRDAILATLSQDDLRHLLSRTEATATVLDELGQNKDTYANLRASVFEKLSDYRVLAALWHHAREEFSLRGWLKSPSTLLLGQATDQRAVISDINRLLFNRASQLLLSQSEHPDVATYFVLDELARAGDLAELPNVLAEGRSRHIGVYIASQTLELLQEVYGEKRTEDLLSHCINKAFLAVSRKTAEWAAEQIGKAEFVELSAVVGKGNKPGELTNQRSLQRSERHVVRPEELTHVPLVDEARGIPLVGTYLSDGFGIVHRDTIPATELFGALLQPLPSHPERDFKERPREHQELPPWTDEDRKRLHLPPRNPTGSTDPFDTFYKYDF